MTISCLCLASLLAASVTLPVATVTEVADHRMSTYPGRVVAMAEVAVVPQVSGEILEVAFQNGQHVKTGDVLYRIDPVKYNAVVKNAEAKLAECRANAKYAELSYTRHQSLLETRAVSLDAADNALSQRDSSRASLAAAEADLVSAKDDLKHCTIVAPIDGKVGSTVKTKGNYVKAAGDPLVTIVQRRPVRVSFSISNRELLEIFAEGGRSKPEDVSVSLTLADGRAYSEPGRVEYADNTSDERTDTVKLYAVFPNDDLRLIVGGTVSITVSSKRGVMRPAIPPSSVLQDTQGPYVWALDEKGVVSRRSIARGTAVGDWLFVEKGLKVGERIVADGAHKVRRGMTVVPAPAAGDRPETPCP